MNKLKYLKRLLAEFCSFAWQNKAWWIFPVLIVLLLVGLLVTTSQTVLPYVYTLF